MQPQADRAGRADSSPLPAPVMAELRRRYAEPHRVHHSWSLVAAQLAEAEEVLGGIGDRTAFVLATLFRHAVLDPRRADGPAASVALMRELLGRAAPARILARAEALIRAAARHEIASTDDPSLRADSALFVDIGLTELGAPPAQYDAYEAALRQEHRHLSDDAWAAGRASALQLLLWRDRIYLTDRYHLPLERRARQNLQRTVARLTG